MPEVSYHADIHLHTTHSDGTTSPAERVREAQELGIDCIAITDHDTVDGVEERLQIVDSTSVIAGTEIRAEASGTKIEILGYFVEPDDEPLEELLEKVRFYRENRNKQMLQLLEETVDQEFSYENLQRKTDGNLGRPHIAEELVDRDVVESIGEAFDRYLGPEGDAFVPMEKHSAPEVIETISAAGGVTSLAHPGRIRARPDNVRRILDDLVDEGLDAIEVWYPYVESWPPEYAEIDQKKAASLAERYGLLRTGGSDCHGPGSGKHRIGDVTVPIEDFREIYRRAEERRSFNRSDIPNILCP